MLQVYLSYVAALQTMLTERLGRAVRLPVAIMTSSDTHGPTLEALRANAYFGLTPPQVALP